MTREEREDALDRGHQYIHCREHDYRGWSDDCGNCPYCEPEKEENEEEEDL